MSDQEQKAIKQKSIKRSTFKLFIVALLMFGFGFALAPLYTLFCAATGLNGKTVNAQNEIIDVKVDKSRDISVRFSTSVHTDLPWQFDANEKKMTVHPGEMAGATFHVVNNAKKTITGQAIPSLAPTYAAAYFHKTECFCFSQQTLTAGEVVDMPLKFYISPDIPKEVKSVVLTYEFFNTNRKQVSTSTTASLH